MEAFGGRGFCCRAALKAARAFFITSSANRRRIRTRPFVHRGGDAVLGFTLGLAAGQALAFWSSLSSGHIPVCVCVCVINTEGRPGLHLTFQSKQFMMIMMNGTVYYRLVGLSEQARAFGVFGSGFDSGAWTGRVGRFNTATKQPNKQTAGIRISPVLDNLTRSQTVLLKKKRVCHFAPSSCKCDPPEGESISRSF